MFLFAAGLAVGLAGVVLKLVRDRDLMVGEVGPAGLSLVALMTLSVPVAQLLLLLLGTDLFGARNLAPAWAGCRS